MDIGLDADGRSLKDVEARAAAYFKAVGWGESSGERTEVLFGPGTQAMLWCTQSSPVAVPAVSTTDSAKQRVRGHDIVDGLRCTLWPPWWIDQAPKVHYVQR